MTVPTPTGEAGWLAAFRDVPVVVVGDIMLDEYVWGDVHRISPEAPVPVVDVTGTSAIPGGAANAAAGIVALGGQARIIGVAGSDEPGTRLVRQLNAGRLDTSGVIRSPSRRTTVKTRVVAAGQHIVRADQEDRLPIDGQLEDEVISAIATAVGSARAMVISDYGKGVVTPRVARAVIEGAGGAIPVIVDPKGSDAGKYAGASLITPNLAESEVLSGRRIRDEADLTEVARRLSGTLGGTAVLITRGADGMALVPGPQAATILISTRARKVFDVTGAGDTVVAVCALCLACGLSLEAAADLASRAAGVAVGKLGTSPVSLRELHED